jgi:putative DNA primase/helicase
LSEIVSPENQQVLVEWAGYSLIPDTRMQKAVMLLGNGSNGKSVYLKLLTRFIGEKNTSGESLHRLENNRFSSANLYGKLINVFPDLASTRIFENSTFKNLCGGDRIHGERKGETAFVFDNTARLIFSANELPPNKNGNFAYFRRWILIDFPNTFEGKAADKDLIEKLVTPEELSGFLNKALAKNTNDGV